MLSKCIATSDQITTLAVRGSSIPMEDKHRRLFAVIWFFNIQLNSIRMHQRFTLEDRGYSAFFVIVFIQRDNGS